VVDAVRPERGVSLADGRADGVVAAAFGVDVPVVVGDADVAAALGSAEPTALTWVVAEGVPAADPAFTAPPGKAPMTM
jgi:hypothetical protein